MAFRAIKEGLMRRLTPMFVEREDIEAFHVSIGVVRDEIRAEVSLKVNGRVLTVYQTMPQRVIEQAAINAMRFYADRLMRLVEVELSRAATQQRSYSRIEIAAVPPGG